MTKIILKAFTLFLILSCAVFNHQALPNSYSFAPIRALKTDNTETETSFLYTIDDQENPTSIQANTLFSLTVKISLDTENVGQNVDLYSVVLLNDVWWILNLDGDYVEMSGEPSALVPFNSTAALTETLSKQIFSGRFSLPGDYSFFTAYAPKGGGVLTYTSQPINISIFAGEPIDSDAETLSLFSKSIGRCNPSQHKRNCAWKGTYKNTQRCNGL